MAKLISPAPVTDKAFWRRTLARCHPDAGGDHELFLFAQSVYEYVAGDGIEEAPPRASREPPQHPQAGERIDFSAAFEVVGSFHELTLRALRIASQVDDEFGRVLRLLADCTEVGEEDVTLYRQQRQGATYKSLAAIGHRAGMSKEQRVRWYRICESIPLSQRHAGHIITRLQEGRG